MKRLRVLEDIGLCDATENILRFPTIRDKITATGRIIVYADIGAEYGDVRPLDEDRVRTLAINGVQLLDRIDAGDAFITELGSPRVGCITWPQREHLINIVQPRDRNDKLLEFLTRRSVAHFKKFINVLSKEQAYLVPLLITDGGESVGCENDFC